MQLDVVAFCQAPGQKSHERKSSRAAMVGRARRWRLLRWLGIETDWGGQLHRLPAAPQAIEPKPVVAGAAARIPDRRRRRQPERDGRPHAVQPDPPPGAAGDGSAEGVKKVQSGQFVLTGTTLAGDRSIAFLQEVAGGKSRTVRKGDKINGMLVAEVLPDRVRFTQWRRIRGADAQGRAGPEDHGRSRRRAAAGPGQPGRSGCRGPARGRGGRRPRRRRRRRPAAGAPRLRPAAAHARRRQGGRRRSAQQEPHSRGDHAPPAGTTPTDPLGPGLSTACSAATRAANDVSTAPRATQKAGRRSRRGPFIGNGNRTALDRAPGTTTMINRLSAPGTILAAIVLLAGCAATYRPDGRRTARACLRRR